MMILPANKCHKEQIINLWQEAFGDKTEDIKKYLNTIFKYFLVYEENGIVKGMLSVLPVKTYQMHLVTSSGEKLPAHSICIYPKPATGVLFNLL